MISARERFCCMLSNGPILPADAIILLCGEDAAPRLAVATQLMRNGGAPLVVVSGGIDDPPRYLGADRIAERLIGCGLTPDRIRIDNVSQHTREQAVAIVRMAVDEGWRRLLLAVSPYHQYRAFLTFLKALQEAEQSETIQLLVVPASQTAWSRSPDGMDVRRLTLLAGEFVKIERYVKDVASYEDGVACLTYWERPHEAGQVVVTTLTIPSAASVAV